MRLMWQILFLFIAGVSHAKETICLNMIVKDESQVIGRLLDSVKGIIDYWVIVDTGSTDGTQEVVRERMRGIPGELFERPWKNFGHNRAEALALAKNRGSYLLFMDADDWLELEPGFQLPPLHHDCYDIWWVNKRCGNFSYLRPQLVKASLPWRWEGVIHEYLTCDLPYTETVLQGVTYVCGGDGARSSDPNKFLKAAQLLEEALQQEPQNSRYRFYLAESYRDAGKPELALAAYERRVAMGGWEEELFWSLLQIAHLKRSLGHPSDEVIQSYYRAHRFRPHRAEPIYYLAELYNQRSEHALAYASLKGWEFIPKPSQKDRLFNLGWIEEYGLLFQLSICSYYLGHQEESLASCNRLLSMPNLPDALRRQTQINRTFSTVETPMKERLYADGHGL